MVSAEKVGLAPQNLGKFLTRVVEPSDGNPGAILKMLSMEKKAKYRLHDHIKTAPLYIDFRLNWEGRSDQSTEAMSPCGFDRAYRVTLFTIKNLSRSPFLFSDLRKEKARTEALLKRY